MAKKERGYDIPLTNQETKEVIGSQKVRFANENKFSIGIKEDGSSLATVEVIQGKPFLIIENQETLNLQQSSYQLEDGRFAYELESLEVDGNNNIKIEITSLEKTSFSSISFMANEIVVRKKGSSPVKHQVEIMDFEFPTNLFSLSQDQESFVKVGTLPSQLMTAMFGLKNVQVLTVDHKGRKLTIAKVGSIKDPTVYVVNGTKMTPHKLEDFYVHVPQTQGRNAFLGIKSSNETSAYGLNDIDQAGLERVVNFISNEESRSKITFLSEEQLNEQILKPRTLAKAKAKTKSVRLTEQELEDTPETNNETPSQNQETQEDENPSNDDDTTTSDESGITPGGQIEGKGLDETDGFGYEGTDGESKEESDTKENKSDKLEEKEEEKEKEKEEGAEKKEDTEEKKEEQQTVDLSDLAKVFGLGLFMFGLFTGIGGILISILAVGIGSNSIVFSKNLKDLPLPQGSKAVKEEIAKRKKNKEMQEENLEEKSTVEKEMEEINSLTEDGFISEEFAKEIQELLSKFEKTHGFMNKVGDFMTKRTSKLEASKNYLNDLIRSGQAKPKHEQQLKVIEDSLTKLKDFSEKFETLKQTSATSIHKHMTAAENHQMLKEQEQELESLNIEESKEIVENQIRPLIEERNNLQTFEEAGTMDPAQQQRLEDVRLEISKLDTELVALYNQGYDYNKVKNEIKDIEKNWLSIQKIEELKGDMINETKQLFKQAHEVSLEAGKTEKLIAGLEKEDRRDIKNINKMSSDLEL